MRALRWLGIALVLAQAAARLTGAESQALTAGLEVTLGTKNGKKRDDD